MSRIANAPLSLHALTALGAPLMLAQCLYEGQFSASANIALWKTAMRGVVPLAQCAPRVGR
jgi:hypothetical protein